MVVDENAVNVYQLERQKLPTKFRRPPTHRRAEATLSRTLLPTRPLGLLKLTRTSLRQLSRRLPIRHHPVSRGRRQTSKRVNRLQPCRLIRRCSRLLPGTESPRWRLVLPPLRQGAHLNQRRAVVEMPMLPVRQGVRTNQQEVL